MKSHKRFILSLLALILVVGEFACIVSNERKWDQSNQREEDKQYMLEEMYKYWHALLRNPQTDEVEVAKLPAAFAAYQSLNNQKQLSKGRSGAFDGLKWQSRGPLTVGGRTRTISISPLDPSGNTAFAGSVGGGIWKSTNLKSATPIWDPVDDFMANIAISSIVYDPQNPVVMYCGTGEGFGNSDAARGLGIAKSNNGGNNWTFLPATQNPSFYFVNKLVVNNSGQVVAATNAGIFRSLNGGSNWEKVLNGSFSDIEINANGVFFVSGNDFSTGIFKSSTGNDGEWEKVNTASSGLPNSAFSRIEMATAQSNPNVVYTLIYNLSNTPSIFQSIDGGITFTKKSIPVDADTEISARDFTRSQGWYDLILKVDPNNENVIYTGGIDAFKSGDGGNSWVQLTHWYGGTFNNVPYQYMHADQHFIEFEGNNSDIIYFTNDGGIFKTSNGTSLVPDITAINTNYVVTQFYASDIHPRAGVNFFLAGAQDNGTQKFSGPGLTTTSQASGGDGAYCNIDTKDPTYMFTQYVFNNYYRSVDGGSSFVGLNSGSLANTGRFINPSKYDSKTKTLYAATGSGRYLRLQNAPSSSTFESITVTGMPGTVSAVAVSVNKIGRIYLGDDAGRITEVVNASNTTSPAAGRSLGTPTANGYVNNIWEDPTNENHLIVIYSGYGVSNIWETFNAQSAAPNWTARQGNLPDIPVYWVLPDPQNATTNVLVATELGVWGTSDFNIANPSWVPVSEGLANVRTTQLHIRASDNLVIASTHGRGLFSTDYFMSAAADFATSARVIYSGDSVSFTNYSVKATSFEWDFNNDGIFDSNEENPVITFKQAGTYTVTLRINGDDNLQKLATISVLPNRGTPYQIEVGGDFETAGDFAADNIGTDKFTRGISTQPGKSGTRSGNNAWVINIDQPKYTGNSTAYLYTPNYNCTASGDYTVSFYAKYTLENTWDGFRVEYSTDKGKNWMILGNVIQNNWYDYNNPDGNRPFPRGEYYFSAVNKTDYSLCTYTTNVFAGQQNVAFRIVFKSDPLEVAAGVAIDDWSLTGPENDEILPVTLLAFTARNEGKINRINWKSSSEVNSSKYELERSFDGKTFSLIKSIASKNSSTGSSYTVLDDIARLSVKNYYYRLKMIDNDGKYAYSKMVFLSVPVAYEKIVVNGTLSTGFVRLLIPESLQTGILTALVYNNAGSLISKSTLVGGIFDLNLTALSSGMYTVSFVHNGKLIQSEKIMIQQ